MNAPMLVPLLGLLSGILVAVEGGSMAWALCTGALASVCYAFLIYIIRKPLASFRLNHLHFIWIYLAFATVGILAAVFTRPYTFGSEKDRTVAVAGQIGRVESKTSGDRAYLNVTHLIEEDGTVREVHNLEMLLRVRALACGVGDEVIVRGTPGEITDSRNFFPSGYAAGMARKGIYYQLTADDGDIELTGHSTTMRGVAEKMRDRLESLIENSGMSKKSQGFLITLLLGDRNYLADDTRNLFADAGISHILALSGMHVAIIAGIVMWLLFPINFFGYYRRRLLITCILLLFYAFMTGLSPSTVRSTLMVMAMMVCVFLERKNTAWNSLLLATFVILVFSPWAILDVGLQLSFLSVAALIFFVNPLNPIRQHDHPRLHRICGVLLATLCATFATWCVSAWYFGTVPVMFLFANIVALPLLPFYLGGALIWFVLLSMGIEFTWLTWAVDSFPKLLEYMVGKLTAGGESALTYSPASLSVWLWIALLVSLVIFLHGKRSKLMIGACLAMALGFAGSCVYADSGKPEGFIIQDFRHCISMVTSGNGKEETVEMPRNAISECRVHGKRIISVDSPIDASEKRDTCEILIVGSGFRGELEDLTTRYSYGTLVVHTSVRRKREDRYISQSDSLGLRCHSLRHEGPLRSFNL